MNPFLSESFYLTKEQEEYYLNLIDSGTIEKVDSLVGKSILDIKEFEPLIKAFKEDDNYKMAVNYQLDTGRKKLDLYVVFNFTKSKKTVPLDFHDTCPFFMVYDRRKKFRDIWKSCLDNFVI